MFVYTSFTVFSMKSHARHSNNSSELVISRKEKRALLRSRKLRVIAVGALFAMVGLLGVSPLLIANSTEVPAKMVRPESSVGYSAASRSEFRKSIDIKGVSTNSDTGDWKMTDFDNINAGAMSSWKADNHTVAVLMDSDEKSLPEGFNSNHATGDVGNAYAFSECTWWAYLRRKQLGLPVGSHFGNGAQWADSAKALGYWVDNTPRHVGDIVVFEAGQAGADSTYGHVAIVEKINSDGSIETSESGASYNGGTFSRTFKNVGDFQYIHY